MGQTMNTPLKHVFFPIEQHRESTATLLKAVHTMHKRNGGIYLKHRYNQLYFSPIFSFLIILV